eukprot:CAMPEP_0181311160 /NCGR_PEP_ID=MMETSP1101-20121128/12981_1 /TAXON_ID=46948 /ORGANISM="Rhodomonas abbreviata, Strain Caron Lab Isolate" /LENGTH=733 /DNA_ID=CAMNT_0023417857 /DNA_START=108 /DNA_END=2309 /DNA_ORIENTATION=-
MPVVAAELGFFSHQAPNLYGSLPSRREDLITSTLYGSHGSSPAYTAPLTSQARAVPSPVQPVYDRTQFSHGSSTTPQSNVASNARIQDLLGRLKAEVNPSPPKIVEPTRPKTASPQKLPTPRTEDIKSFLNKCDREELLGFLEGMVNAEFFGVRNYLTEKMQSKGETSPSNRSSPLEEHSTPTVFKLGHAKIRAEDSPTQSSKAAHPPPALLSPPGTQTKRSLDFADPLPIKPFTCETIATSRKAPETPQCNPPPPSVEANSFHEYTYCVSKKEVTMHRLQDLTPLDEHYHNNPHRIQRIGFHYASMLSPTKLMQSLQLTIEDFPIVGSKVVHCHGQTGLRHRFHLDAENVSIRLINVEPHMLDSMERCEELCEAVTPRSPDQKENPLFECWIFKSSDISKGSILIAGFQHTLGDATSYGIFMRRWSEHFQQIAKTEEASNDHLLLPPGVFTDYACIPKRFPKNPLGTIYRSYAFSDFALAAVKRAVSNSGCKELLSGNDILLAQCAVALAPTRFQASGQHLDSLTRIFILCDSRGKSLPAGSWGNHVSDVVVDLPWRMLLEGNVGRVAALCRKRLLTDMDLLKNNLAQFNYNRSMRMDVPKLFVWNSWAKPGELMRCAQFSGPTDSSSVDPSPEVTPSSSSSNLYSSLYSTAGTVGNAGDADKNLIELAWFNAKWFADPVTVLVTPLACPCPERGDARIAVHVASPPEMADAELQHLLRFWHGAQIDVVPMV